jgi:hypothetical protein
MHFVLEYSVVLAFNVDGDIPYQLNTKCPATTGYLLMHILCFWILSIVLFLSKTPSVSPGGDRD